MKRVVLCFLLGIMVITWNVFAYAEEAQSVEATKGHIKIVVDGEEVEKEILLYNDSSYVQLVPVLEVLGITWEYDNETSTIFIGDSEAQLDIKNTTESDGGYTFRNTNWGDDPETVIASETAKYYKSGVAPALEDNVLMYVDKLAGFDIYFVYIFDLEERLYRAFYRLTNKHSMAQLYISDYDNLKSLLIDKYGTPKKDDVIALNIMASYLDEGTALTSGSKAYQAIWDIDETTITLQMAADNLEVKTTIVYESTKIIPTYDTTGF